MYGVPRERLLGNRQRPVPIPRYQISRNGSETMQSDAVSGDSVPDQTLEAVNVHQPRAVRNLDTSVSISLDEMELQSVLRWIVIPQTFEF